MEDIELRPQDGESLGRRGGRAGPAMGCFSFLLPFVYISFVLPFISIFYFLSWRNWGKVKGEPHSDGWIPQLREWTLDGFREMIEPYKKGLLAASGRKL